MECSSSMSAPKKLDQDIRRYLKKTPHGEDAKRFLRIRAQAQFVDSEVFDPMTSRIEPTIERHRPHLKGSILDVGCYTGHLYHFLGKPRGYVGIDTWTEAIEVAKEFAPEADFRVCDLFKMEGRFDIIWSSQVMWSRASIGVGEVLDKIKSLGDKYIVVLSSEYAKGQGTHLGGDLFLISNV